MPCSWGVGRALCSEASYGWLFLPLLPHRHPGPASDTLELFLSLLGARATSGPGRPSAPQSACPWCLTLPLCRKPVCLHPCGRHWVWHIVGASCVSEQRRELGLGLSTHPALLKPLPPSIPPSLGDRGLLLPFTAGSFRDNLQCPLGELDFF